MRFWLWGEIDWLADLWRMARGGPLRWPAGVFDWVSLVVAFLVSAGLGLVASVLLAPFWLSVVVVALAPVVVLLAWWLGG